jgi:hypothetical protein
MTKHNAALNQARDDQHHQAVDKAIREAINETTRAQELSLANMRLPGDPWTLRGIPAVGGRGSIGGAIQGTRPDTLAWDNERQPRRKL